MPMEQSENLTLWFDTGSKRAYLIPDDVSLPRGAICLRSMAGRLRMVEEGSAAQFSVSQRIAMVYVGQYWRRLLGRASVALSGKISRLGLRSVARKIASLGLVDHHKDDEARGDGQHGVHARRGSGSESAPLTVASDDRSLHRLATMTQETGQSVRGLATDERRSEREEVHLHKALDELEQAVWAINEGQGRRRASTGGAGALAATGMSTGTSMSTSTATSGAGSEGSAEVSEAASEAASELASELTEVMAYLHVRASRLDDDAARMISLGRRMAVYLRKRAASLREQAERISEVAGDERIC